MRLSRRNTGVAGVALSLVALFGCGTTVRGVGNSAAGTSELGLGGPSIGPGGVGPAGATVGGPTGTGVGLTGPGGTGATSSGGSGTVGTSPIVTALGNGVGVTATEIFIGMVHAENTDAVNAAGGVADATLGDPNADAKAIIDYINKGGGVAGRKLHLVEAPFDSASTQDVETQWGRVCAQFTQDNPRVFAVLDAGTASYRACISRAGVAQIDDDLPQANAAEFQDYPGFIELGYPNLNRLAAEQVTALVDQDYFIPWDTTFGRPAKSGKAKVGIITYDDPAYRDAVKNILVPRLTQLGYPPKVAWIGDVSRASDYGSQSAAVKSTQLKFASSGIDHVIIFESNGGLSLFFMPNAQTQGYHPRYGVNSTSALQYLVSGHEVSPSQAQGAMGFGWIPAFDVQDQYNPDDGPYSNPTRRTCLAVLKDHGIEYSGANAESVAVGICSRLFLLRQVLGTVLVVVNRDGFINAINGLGSAFVSGGSLGEYFAPGRHDGTSKVYFWRWFDSCGCMNYTGPRRTIP